jgi:hypothetical protein
MVARKKSLGGQYEKAVVLGQQDGRPGEVAFMGIQSVAYEVSIRTLVQWLPRLCDPFPFFFSPGRGWILFARCSFMWTFCVCVDHRWHGTHFKCTYCFCVDGGQTI